ncbi:hypothetical protein [Aureivirga sp. CE67]|uniref:hypothetical protein n=1 Tax=Aureivirga sp. CE67 TaxID=1788983 RepID=UPI0018C9896E|nr:hypothetical protein [Aureivirga sp. CE67]
MKNQIYLVLLLLCSTISYGKINNFKQNEPKKKTLKSILPSNQIPVDFRVFEKYGGDLNGDGKIDSVFIVKRTCPEIMEANQWGQLVNRNKRGIMVFFQQNNQWISVLENLSCFLSENEDGGVYMPPMLSLDIEKNKLFVFYSHGRYGSWSYTFRFNKKKSDFDLIGYDNTSMYGPAILSSTSINFLTKKEKTRKNPNKNINPQNPNKKAFVETWRNIDVDRIIQLSEIENFDELDLP